MERTERLKAVVSATKRVKIDYIGVLDEVEPILDKIKALGVVIGAAAEGDKNIEYLVVLGNIIEGFCEEIAEGLNRFDPGQSACTGADNRA